jgi:hypothetical protein
MPFFPYFRARHLWLAVALAAGLNSGVIRARAEILDPSAVAGNVFAPFVVRLHGDLKMKPQPAWMPTVAKVDEEMGSVEIPLPSLREQPVVERFVVTVVFEDGGDGGPSVEWRARNKDVQAVSDGLGEVLDDRPLGLNARSILLPEELTKPGGTLLVSYFGRFDSLISVTIQPATQSVVAVTGGSVDPALVDKQLKVLTAEQTDGRRLSPLSGDIRDGAVVEAELSAAIEPFADEIEFIVPVEGTLEGVVVKADMLGLDPEGAVEVFVNDKRAGSLGLESVALDGPSIVQDERGRLVVAGWRSGSLFLPVRFWKDGENRLLLKLRRAEGEAGKPVFVRNSSLHLRFGSSKEVANETEEPEAVVGEQEIDFSQAPSVIEVPREPRMPVVVTTKP